MLYFIIKDKDNHVLFERYTDESKLSVDDVEEVKSIFDNSDDVLSFSLDLNKESNNCQAQVEYSGDLDLEDNDALADLVNILSGHAFVSPRGLAWHGESFMSDALQRVHDLYVDEFSCCHDGHDGYDMPRCHDGHDSHDSHDNHDSHDTHDSHDSHNNHSNNPSRLCDLYMDEFPLYHKSITPYTLPRCLMNHDNKEYGHYETQNNLGKTKTWWAPPTPIKTQESNPCEQTSEDVITEWSLNPTTIKALHDFIGYLRTQESWATLLDELRFYTAPDNPTGKQELINKFLEHMRQQENQDRKA